MPTTVCTIERCAEPKHVAPTGLHHATMCDAHDAMFNVLQGALRRRSGATAGATALFRDIEASADGLVVLEADWRRRFGSTEGVASLFRRIEAARNRP